MVDKYILVMTQEACTADITTALVGIGTIFIQHVCANLVEGCSLVVRLVHPGQADKPLQSTARRTEQKGSLVALVVKQVSSEQVVVPDIVEVEAHKSGMTNKSIHHPLAEDTRRSDVRQSGLLEHPALLLVRKCTIFPG